MRHVNKKMTALICATSAAAFLAACDDSDDEPDARPPQVFDAGGPDGTPADGGPADGGLDAAPFYPGTVSVQEVRFANPALAPAGQGVQISITFEDGLAAVKPIMEEQPGQPFGCKVWEYTQEQSLVPSTNEGTVKVEIEPSGDNTAPVYPDCVHNPVTGYVCASAGGAAATAAITDNPTGDPPAPTPADGRWVFTLASANFSETLTPGSYLNISGATNAANNGAFPILARLSATSLLILNTRPTAGAEVLAGGMYAVVSGIGPNPARQTEPFWMDNDAKVTVTITGTDDTHLGDLTAEVANVGDSFTLSEASPIADIPMDGSAFTIGCADGACPSGSAAGSILNIVTTDGDTTGVPAPLMPPIKEGGKRVQVRCAQLGAAATSITVPAAYSAYLMNSGATRIQASFLRSGLAQESTVNVVAGHGVVGYTEVEAAK
jgi:hypothetical protein